MWRSWPLLFLLACGSSSETEAGALDGSDETGRDGTVAVESGVDADAGDAIAMTDATTDAGNEGGCVVVVSGALGATLQCVARVLPADSTHEGFHLVSTFSFPTSVAIDCIEPRPIEAGTYTSPVVSGIGCQASIADYFADGGPNHIWGTLPMGSSTTVILTTVGAFDGGIAPVQGSASGKLLQTFPVNGMAGPVMVQATF